MTPAAIWWRYAERAMDLMKLYAKYPSVTAAAWFSIFLEQAEPRLLPFNCIGSSPAACNIIIPTGRDRNKIRRPANQAWKNHVADIFDTNCIHHPALDVRLC